MFVKLVLSLFITSANPSDSLYTVTRFDGAYPIYREDDETRSRHPEVFQLRRVEIDTDKQLIYFSKAEPEGSVEDLRQQLELNYNRLDFAIRKGESTTLTLLPANEIPESERDYVTTQLRWEIILNDNQKLSPGPAKRLQIYRHVVAFKFLGWSEKKRALVQPVKLNPIVESAILDVGGRLDRERLDSFTQPYSYVEVGDDRDGE